MRGLTRVEVRSEEEALAQFFTGEQGRRYVPGGHHAIRSNAPMAVCPASIVGTRPLHAKSTPMVLGAAAADASCLFFPFTTRSTAVHVLNNSSSRSHALFSVYVETRASAEASERALLSKLHLVDLAGSERTKKTNPSGEQLREASCINKSLTFLEQVVNALARKDNHVPFR